MHRVLFQNGADAAYSVVVDEFETEEQAKAAVEQAVAEFGTAGDAVAWIDGRKAPKFAKPVTELVPKLELSKPSEEAGPES